MIKNKIVKECLPNQLKYSIRYCQTLVKENKPAVIVVDGGLGEGKTTLATGLADYGNGKEYPFEEIIGLGGKDFLRVYEEQKGKKKVLVYDEAGDYSRRGAMTKFNRDLSRIFETFRQFQIILILVLPRFYWLDSSIFELGVVKMVLHCYGRKKSGRYTCWFPDNIDWLITNADKLKKRGAPMKLVYGKVTPNQRGHFYNLSKKRAEDLTKYSLKGKVALTDEALISSEGLMSLNDFAEKIGKSYSWVKTKFREKKLKPAKIIKKKHYYGKELLNVLMDDMYGGGE